MGQPWIKIETATPDKAEVWQIAAKLQLDPDLVMGKLVRFWGWVDQNFADKCPRISGQVSGHVALVDAVVRVPGFARALAEVGWLVLDDDGMEIPNYEEHLSQSAKQRALDARRKAKSRANSSDTEPDKRPPANRTTAGQSSDKIVTRGEERRINTPPTPQRNGVHTERGGLFASTEEPDPEAAENAEAAYDAEVTRLVSLGVLKGRGCVDAARAAGRSPDLVREIIDCWVQNRDTLQAGAVVLRLEAPLVPGEHGASHWPNENKLRPTPAAVNGARVESFAKAAALHENYAAASAEREAEDAQRAADDAEFGPQLDALPIDAIEAMVRDAYGESAEFTLTRMRRAGGIRGDLRATLVRRLAESRGPP